MSNLELRTASIDTLVKAMKKQELSPVELVNWYLERIEKLNPVLNSYITVCADEAREQARKAEALLANKAETGPLVGVPIALKDQIFTKGIRTTNGSLYYKDHVPTEDATVVTKLKDAGAIIIGKANMSEFALGGTRKYPYGTPRNPWDLDRDPGTSSAGSGSAVSARLCAASLGEDTGGSVRGPAGHCGVVGIRPTYGRISRHGFFGAVWFTDTIGPITSCVEDNALIVRTIAGKDSKDVTTKPIPVPNYTEGLGKSIKGLRIGILKEYMEHEGLDSEVRTVVETATEVFRELGASVKPVSVPFVSRSGPVFIALADSEAAAATDHVLRDNSASLDSATRTRLLAGSLTPSYIYHRALRAKAMLTNQFHAAFKDVDILISPTQPTAAPLIETGEKVFDSAEDVAERLHTHRSFCASFAMAALPAISIPCGLTPNGLPVGLHLAGRPFEEEVLFQAGYAYQETTQWNKSLPPLAVT